MGVFLAAPRSVFMTHRPSVIVVEIGARSEGMDKGQGRSGSGASGKAATASRRRGSRSAGGGGASQESKSNSLGRAQEVLLKRMEEKLPLQLDKMRKLGKKTGHWIWWAFPSKLPGRSEPSPSTHVTEETAVEVIAKAPKVWRALLECICDLVEKNGKGVLPSIDHRRVGHFVRFWSNVHESPPWLKAVLERLAPFYGSEPP